MRAGPLLLRGRASRRAGLGDLGAQAVRLQRDVAADGAGRTQGRRRLAIDQQLRAAGVRHRDLHAPVRDGHLVRSRRGRYRLADLATHLDVAIELTATLSHRSAALHHGLEVATVPERPEVVVRRNRNLTEDQRRRATVRWSSGCGRSGCG